MDEHDFSHSPPILLIDNNSLTTNLLLRLFRVIHCPVVEAKTRQNVDFQKHNKFKLILINLANDYEDFWISVCIRYFQQGTLLIGYIPEFLIQDFTNAATYSETLTTGDEWMLESKLYRLLQVMLTSKFI